MKRSIWFAAIALMIAGAAFAGTITVTQPAGGSFAMGAACPVHWTASGVSGSVKIQLIHPGGGLVGLLAGRLDPGSSPYPWVVAAPAAAGETYKVRVSALDGSATGESAEFSVTAGGGPAPAGTIGSVRLSGASPYTIGSGVTVSWSATGVSQNLKLQLLRSGGGMVGDIATSLAAGTTSYSWTAGSYIGGTAGAGGYKVLVATVDGTLGAESAGFTLAAPSGAGAFITVTSPGVGSDWRPGSRQTITWTKTGELSPMANITLRREGAPETEAAAVRIADGCANNGSRVWFIPDDLAEGRYFVRVRSGSVQDDSAVFAVSAEGRGSDLAGPDTPIRADLQIAGVGVEYYNGAIVVWVRNNGPDGVRDHDVTFRLHFPERESSAHILPQRITVPVGGEEGVRLMLMARSDIPDTGLRTIVSIDSALSHIVDANLLNQHRDLRIYADNRTPIDLEIELDRGRTTISHVLVATGKPFTHKYHIRGWMRLRNLSDSPAEIARVACRWVSQSRNTFETEWRDGYPASNGTLQLGPFRRRGEWTTCVFEFDFLVHDYHDVVYHRVFFELDPDRLLNDPNRDNNVAASGQWDHK